MFDNPIASAGRDANDGSGKTTLTNDKTKESYNSLSSKCHREKPSFAYEACIQTFPYKHAERSLGAARQARWRGDVIAEGHVCAILE